MTSKDTELIAFKAINDFVNSLHDLFNKIHRPLKLYKRLINHTLISNSQVIKKHVDTFREFCIENRDAIMEKQFSNFTRNRVIYSERVFIDIKLLLKSCKDPEVLNNIWKHIIYISALLDPAGRAKEILKANINEPEISKETEFVNNLISSIENSNVDSNDPMSAISTLMTSGIFGNMMSGMQNGNLNMSKLFGVIQGLAQNLEQQVGDNQEAKQSMAMLSNLMSSVNTTIEKEQIDLSSNASQQTPSEQNPEKPDSV